MNKMHLYNEKIGSKVIFYCTNSYTNNMQCKNKSFEKDDPIYGYIRHPYCEQCLQLIEKESYIPYKFCNKKHCGTLLEADAQSDFCVRHEIDTKLEVYAFMGGTNKSIVSLKNMYRNFLCLAKDKDKCCHEPVDVSCYGTATPFCNDHNLILYDRALLYGFCKTYGCLRWVSNQHEFCGNCGGEDFLNGDYASSRGHRFKF